MLKQRLVTAVIGLPLLLSAIIFLPKIYISFIFLLFVCTTVFEISRMLYPALMSKFQVAGKDAEKSNGKWAASFCVLAAALMYAVAIMMNLSSTERGGIIAVFMLVMLIATFSGKTIDQSMAHLICVLVSLCYGCLPWMTIWDLYLMGDHARYVLLTLAIVMMGDSGAYFSGLYFGKRKLAPRLSPKKTWEGVVGGLIASILGSLTINLIFQWSLGPAWLMVILALIAGTAGVLGDLLESSFKRFADVKDSGSILPGHGGFLDRVDSILFAAPMVWLILYTYVNLIGTFSS